MFYEATLMKLIRLCSQYIIHCHILFSAGEEKSKVHLGKRVMHIIYIYICIKLGGIPCTYNMIKYGTVIGQNIF